MREPWLPSTDVEHQPGDSFMSDKDKGRGGGLVRPMPPSWPTSTRSSSRRTTASELLFRSGASILPSLSEDEHAPVEFATGSNYS